MSDNLTMCENRGYSSYYSGVELNKNPHPIDSREFKEWRYGWMTASNKECEIPSNLEDRVREAVVKLMIVLTDVENIVKAEPISYADAETNWKRPYNATHKFTLKEARQKARNAVFNIREIWQLLDPV